MNYDIKAELLAEGWKHEQLIEEDWEDLKKELADLYVAGKITERQISTRLSKAGMGGLSRNAAYKIAHDPDNVQKREINLQRVRAAEEKKEKEAAKKADPNYGKTRGTLAQEYCNAWNKKFGHIVKAGVVKEALEDELFDYLFENNIVLSEEEQSELVAETMNEILSEDLLEEGLNVKKEIKKIVKAYESFKMSIDKARMQLVNDEDGNQRLKEKIKKITEYDSTIKDLKKILSEENITKDRAKRIKKNLKQFRKDIKTLKNDTTFVKVLKSIGAGYAWGILYAAIAGMTGGVIAGIGAVTDSDGLTMAGLAGAGIGGGIGAEVGGVVKGYKHYKNRDEKEIKILKKKTPTAKELTEAVVQSSQDVKMLYDDGTWSLVSPTTFKGTRKVSYYIENGKKVPTHWATRAQERYFDAFTKDGPLYIIRNTRTGKAYQIGKFNGKTLFQDQDDMPISKAECASIPRSLLSRIKGVSASVITENWFNY